MYIKEEQLYLCLECTRIVLKDSAALDFSYSKEEKIKRLKEINIGITTLQKNLNGILHSNFNGMKHQGILNDSTLRCDCCNTKVVGTRYRFDILVQED